MYAEPGTAYVYFTYGMHHCFNVVCGRADEPVAVLLRALEPLGGKELMHARRQRHPDRRLAETALCSGPAKLCEAFGIDRALNGQDLTRGETIWIEHGPGPYAITTTSRVGVGYAEDWAGAPLRFYDTLSAHVSRRDRAADGRARPPE